MTAPLVAALLWLQFQLGALRPIERLHGAWGEVALGVVWVASAAAAWRVARRPPRWRVLATAWPSVALVALVAACALFVYPEVDARRATGGGSDADDAVLLVVDRIRDGLDPFGEDTYLGNPPTTGPGSALWAAPFPGRRAYACGVAIAVAGVLVALRRRHGSWEVASWTAVVLGAAVPFWEGVAQGNDHLAMSAGLALLAIGLDRWPIVASTVLASVLATWRAAYLHLPLLAGLARRRSGWRSAAVLAGAGIVLAVALHAVLLRWTSGGWDAYDPVRQLSTKSDEDLSAWGRLLVAAAVAGSGVVVVAESARRRPRVEVLLLAGIGGPLGAIAIAGLASANDPAGWSEASYLLPTLVLAAVVTARALAGAEVARNEPPEPRR